MAGNIIEIAFQIRQFRKLLWWNHANVPRKISALSKVTHSLFHSHFSQALPSQPITYSSLVAAWSDITVDPGDPGAQRSTEQLLQGVPSAVTNVMSLSDSYLLPLWHSTEAPLSPVNTPWNSGEWSWVVQCGGCPIGVSLVGRQEDYIMRCIRLVTQLVDSMRQTVQLNTFSSAVAVKKLLLLHTTT